jgi:glycosyltransferase involved in cell wall biosynthesis
MADPAATSVVIPAFNEGAAVGEVVAALRQAAAWHEILVVDDGSTDDTARHAETAGATVVRHPYNKGNGASVKSGIRRSTGEFVLILDGDGQHKPEDACRLVAALGEYDLVVGARDPRTQASGRRRLGNAVLNWLAGYLAGRAIPDLTSGLRAMRREHVREFLGLLPNGFSSPTTITLSFIRAGHSVRFEPVQARQRTGHSKIRLARDGVKFFLILLRVITIFSPLRIFLPIAALSFAIGVAYGIWNVWRTHHIPNGAVIAIMFAVIIVLVGLVSEQISALRASQRG